MPEDEKHYWIASLYALLMPKARRRRLAAYFTPPHLAHYAIDTLIEAGIKAGQHRILDPASGGAAFLVPLAARISDQARQRGAGGETILRAIESSLAGVEIEPDLATLSKALLLDLLRNEIDSAGRKPTISIQRADTLKLPPPETLYDAAIGNPPYGRIFRPSKTILSAFAPVISDGYAGQENGRGDEAKNYKDLVDILKVIPVPAMKETMERQLSEKRTAYEADGLIAKQHQNSQTLASQVDANQEWARRYNPIKLAI